MAFIYKAFLLTTLAVLSSAQNGYHYNSFTGPVSGQIRQVQVPVGVAPAHPHYQNVQLPVDPHHQHFQRPHSQAYTQESTVDYEAKPDYVFAYGVEDPHSGTTQNHKETRDGDVTRGQYNVVQPDGSVRTVTYTADSKNGFQATVHNTAPTIKQQQYASPPGTVHYQPKRQYNNGQYNNGQYNNGQYNNNNNNNNNGQYHGGYNGDY